MSKRLGQHFLINQSALRMIARAINPQPGDTIVEIGPGHGELTRELQISNVKCQIVAIEKDARLVEFLREKFGKASGIEIIEGDALKLLPQITKSYKLTATSYKIVGNIPYYITGHLLRIMSELDHKPGRVVFTIQREVAERIVARPRSMNPHTKKVGVGMNRLAAIVQFWGTPKILHTLHPADFYPKPTVDSAVLEIVTHDENIQHAPIRPVDYYRTVYLLFQQPRKTIFNNLRAVAQSTEYLHQLLAQLDIAEQSRPQDLSIDQIVRIAKKLLPA